MLSEDQVLIALAGEEEDVTPAGVPECLVDYHKRMHPLATGHVDSDNISAELVMEIRHKIMPNDISFRRPEVRHHEVPGHGQGGLIRKEPTQRSLGESIPRYAVIPVTAKHNLRQVELNGHWYTPVEAKLNASSCGRVLLQSADLGWKRKDTDSFMLRPELDPNNTNLGAPVCRFGFDLSLGSEIDSTENPVTQPFCSFSMVRKTLVPKKGQRVGIAVILSEDTKPTEQTISGCGGPVKLDDFDEKFTIEDVYGKPGKVNVYTGEITYVGNKHIEYSINSFTGCSGAIVFLLDKNQPESVQECDFGCAIAIHASAHPVLYNRNYGFLLREHPALKSV